MMPGVFNWGLAMPEIVLALCAMAILILGVLRKHDSNLMCTMLGLGALVLTAALILSTPDGVGYRNLFIVDGFARFMKLLILAGAAMSAVLALDYNVKQGIARFEFAVPDPAVHGRHDDHVQCVEPDDLVSRSRAAVVGALHHVRLRSRRAEILRSRA